MEKPKNSAQLTALLNTVGSKQGMSPEKLRKELEAGKFDRALAGMDEKSAAKFRQVLADPKKLDQIMSSRQAKALYEKLTG